MEKPKLIQLFGEGESVDKIEKRLSSKGFEVHRYLRSPYSDAEVVLIYEGRTYTDDGIGQLLPRIAPRED